MGWIARGVLVIVVFAAAPSGAQTEEQSGKPPVDPRADAMLRKMSNFLGQQKRFSFNATHATDVVQKDGHKLEFGADSSVEVERPNHLRSERRGPRGGANIIYDGKNLSIITPKENMFASVKAPADLDQAIPWAADQLSLDAPAADLLLTDVYSALMPQVRSGTYVGLVHINGMQCHHLAFQADKVDWQLWVRDGDSPLPCKYLITTTDMKAQPQHSVEFSDWNLNPQFSQDTFAFNPPASATRVEVLGAAKPAAQGNRPSGGTP